MSEEWQPLPAAEKQVTEIARIFGIEHSRTLIGKAAREEVVKSESAACDILHFATHGILNDTAPLYSYLLLAQENLAPGEDGLLEGWELMRIKMRARLAVLSACETARGRVSDGEGIVGLSWAMLVAGCPATLVSQWKVDSASNTALMVDFYRRIHDGSSVADALRQASLALMKTPEYRHPFFWAPFVAVGSVD
jgi:CHAT domain-containing protein